MCLADPSGNPRPKRMIELLKSLNIGVDVLSYPSKEKVTTGRHYNVYIWPKTILKRFLRFSVRLLLWFIPINGMKNWANKKYYGVSNISKELYESDYNLIVVEDLQLVPIAFEIQKNAKIILDAREYYPLQNEESLIFRWFEKPERMRLCRTYLSKCDAVLTVSNGLALEYLKEFDIQTHLLRSTPNYYECEASQVEPDNIKMVHHGAANENRHLEKMIEVFSLLDSRFSLDLYLVGDCKYINKLKELANPFKGISFKEAVLFDAILPTLNNYDVGLYYVDSETFNVKNCLPNKFFEFIQARLMVAIGPSPDMAELVHEYDCGVVSDAFDTKEMADKLNDLTNSDIMKYKKNSDLASKVLCFEQEGKKLTKIITSLMERESGY